MSVYTTMAFPVTREILKELSINFNDFGELDYSDKKFVYKEMLNEMHPELLIKFVDPFILKSVLQSVLDVMPSSVCKQLADSVAYVFFDRAQKFAEQMFGEEQYDDETKLEIIQKKYKNGDYEEYEPGDE